MNLSFIWSFNKYLLSINCIKNSAVNQQIMKMMFWCEGRQWTNKWEFKIEMGVTKTIKRNGRPESYLCGKREGELLKLGGQRWPLWGETWRLSRHQSQALKECVSWIWKYTQPRERAWAHKGILLGTACWIRFKRRMAGWFSCLPIQQVNDISSVHSK